MVLVDIGRMLVQLINLLSSGMIGEDTSTNVHYLGLLLDVLNKSLMLDLDIEIDFYSMEVQSPQFLSYRSA